jgi:hypothetical protein
MVHRNAREPAKCCLPLPSCYSRPVAEGLRRIRVAFQLGCGARTRNNASEIAQDRARIDRADGGVFTVYAVR